MYIKKIIEKIKDFFPGKRIFFIYTHHNSWNRFARGLKASTELSFWNLKALRKHFPRVTFLRLEGEKPQRIKRISENDVVIGHIGETYYKASQRSKKIIAFYPWCGHEDRSTNNKFNCIQQKTELDYLSLARSIIFLTSEYNVREYLHKPTNFWFDFYKNNNVRFVHQPIDLNQFKRIKFTYETSNFLYIGNQAHMKCVNHSKELVKSVKRIFFLYGTKKNNRLDNLDSKAIHRLTEEADFFIQPGMWEGQCVSILEAAARGFIPIVSKETGYPYDHPFLLRYNDFEYNKKQLIELLNTTPQERRSLANTLHKSLKHDTNHNNWECLTNTLVEEIKKIL